MSEQKSDKTKLIVILAVVIGLIALALVLISSNTPGKKGSHRTAKVEENAVEQVATQEEKSSDSEETAATSEDESAPAEKTAESEDTASITDPDADPVVAVVDGVDVKRSEVFRFVNNLPPNMRQQIPPEDLFPLALEQMISGKIVEIKASKQNLDGNKDVEERLAEAKKQIIRAVFLEKEMQKRLTEKRVKKAYDDYVKKQGDVQEIKARHILVDSQEKANDLVKELEDGADFVTLAKEHSDGPSGARGGDLGYFTEDDMVPEFSKVAFATKVGEYTKKPVKTRFGWHVIKVEDKRVRKPSPYEEVKPILEAQERRMILDELIGEWVKEARIETFDINGNPLPAEEKSK